MIYQVYNTIILFDFQRYTCRLSNKVNKHANGLLGLVNELLGLVIELFDLVIQVTDSFKINVR